MPGKILHAIMPAAKAEYYIPLNLAMSAYDIVTPKKVASFISQIAVESHEMRKFRELWTSKIFQLPGSSRVPYTAENIEDYFEYWYGNRLDLGNDEKGDGYKYHGRGAIQITGKAMYKKVGDGINIDLVKNPDIIETDIVVNMKASAFFFSMIKNASAVSELVDHLSEASAISINRKVTRLVNGGENGIDDRLKYYRSALKVLC